MAAHPALLLALAAVALATVACDGAIERRSLSVSHFTPPVAAGADADAPDGGAPDIAAADALDTASPPLDTAVPEDTAPLADAGPDAADTVAADTAAPPEPLTAPVAHARELRAVWIATVWNINFPSDTGLGAAALRAELDALVAVAAEAGLNALVFQVRAEGDAFYASAFEPWSRFLSGTQGVDPGLDPLAYLITAAHAQNLEVHAWLNPYRARTSTAAPLAPSHMASLWPAFAYPYGSLVWMDPAAPAVQDRLLDVVDDLVTGYDLDGVHFDDYFYPYPDGPFPDDASYAAYQAAGGLLARADWRRDNVNRMVADVHALVRTVAPDVRFGIAPFGIYRPGQPAGITGLDQYASLYADPVRWMLDGHVDYIAPQLYWPTTRTAQAYEALLAWWADVAPGMAVFAGNYLSQLGSASDWTVAEFREQLRLSRLYRGDGSLGNIWYQVGPLVENRAGIRDVFRDEFYAAPALPPALPHAGLPVAPPTLAPAPGAALGTFDVSHAGDRALKGATLYRRDGDGWALDRVIPAPASRVAVPASGTWALATVTRDGVESLGVVITDGAVVMTAP